MASVTSMMFYTPTFYLCLILVIIFALSDFYRPYSRKYFRVLVSRRRHIMGAAIYLLGALFVFCLLVPLIARVYQIWLQQLIRSNPVQTTDLTGQAVSVGATTSIILLAVLRWLPFIGYLVDVAHRSAHALSYFPASMNELLLLMDRTDFIPHEGAFHSVNDELSAYGISLDKRGRTYLAGPVSMAEEIETVRLRIREMGNERRFSSVSAIVNQQDDPIRDGLDLSRSKFFGQLAKAFVIMNGLDQDPVVSNSIMNKSVAKPLGALAGIMEDNGAAVLSCYRRAAAAFALSEISNPRTRSEFLMKLGYRVPERLAMPFWPIVASFAAVFIGMILPQLLISQPLWLIVGKVPFFFIASTQAIISSLAILWAIWPKHHFNFARPSLTKLPIKSYPIYAAGAYATSIFLMQLLFLAFPQLPFARHVPQSYLIQSLLPMFYTIIVSVLIDRHLLRSTTLGMRDRLVDGLITCVAVGLGEIVLSHLFERFVGVAITSDLVKLFPPAIAGWLVLIGFSEFTLILASIGFIIGFFVPVTAAEAIQRNSPIRQGGFLGTDREERLKALDSLPRAVIHVPSKEAALG